MERSVIDVDGGLAQLATIRRAVVAFACAWRAPIDESVLALLVSEVLANAMEHGEPPITVTVDWDEHRLRVSISDASSATPIHRRPSVGDGDGRGIWLVDRQASAWGVEQAPKGKTVWFELG